MVCDDISVPWSLYSLEQENLILFATCFLSIHPVFSSFLPFLLCFSLLSSSSHSLRILEL